MKYRDVLSMSRNCPKCCKEAMERLTKYMPARDILLKDTENSKTKMPVEAPAAVKEETVEKEEAPVTNSQQVKKVSHKNKRCKKRGYLRY